MKNFLPAKTPHFFILLLVAFLFSSCAQPIPVEACVTVELYGFWSGLLHGFIAPFTFIGSLISDDIAMYAINNNGAWYNFGFLFGAAIFFGGSGNRTSGK